jgi:hypothetical protein
MTGDSIRSWLVCLLPEFVAGWIWEWSETSGVPLGAWAPHIFGRSIGAVRWKRVAAKEPRR